MSWEELPERSRRDRTEWGITIAKNGITLWMPKDHWMSRHTKVKTHLGKGDHAGWIRIEPNGAGRAVNKTKGDKPSHFIRYSTLPVAPPALSLAVCQVRDRPGGAQVVEVRLPWAYVGANGKLECRLPGAVASPPFSILADQRHQ